MRVEVEQVEGRRGLARFVAVPWAFRYRGARGGGVPPLRVAVREMLDERVDPFYQRADRALFVAHRAGRPVGRVAAIENRTHNEHFGDRIGFFGFFESVDDPDVSGALLRAAEAWLRDRGLEASRGPISPSLHHECGLLVDGFEATHVALTTWNPSYYGPLMEHGGYRGVRDLLAYDVPVARGFPGEERLQRLAERGRRSLAVTVRAPDFADFEREIRHVLPVYREAWSGNWGFVPPTLDEFRHLASGLKPLLRRDFCFVAESEGEAVAFLMIMADINRLIPTRSSGRMTPLMLARLLWGRRRLRSGRLILLGVLPEHRHRFLLPVILYEGLLRGRALGFERVEASWILEDNRALRGPMESLGLRPYRRWRIYERSWAALRARA